MPTIEILEGQLTDGKSLELLVDFTDDALSFSHTKKFIAFSERNIKYDQFKEQYYYDEGKGVVYESTDADNLYIDKLVTGRLFVLFKYTTIYGNSYTLSKVFNVLPEVIIVVGDNIIADSLASFNVTSNIENISASWYFDDQLIVGNDIERIFVNDGYQSVTVVLDCTDLKYKNNDDVVWFSTPENKLVNITSGYFGGGTVVKDNLYLQVPTTFLVKYNLAEKINLNINISANSEGNYIAPLNSLITDNSTYDITFEGTNRVEYTLINFGDGDIRKSTSVNFEYFKLFKRSGTFNIIYTVNTIHEPVNGASYRQQLTYNTSVTIKPFFEKFFKEQFVAGLYKSDGFNDLASAWGIQMDRVYNETQMLLESIDIDYLENTFLSSVAFTYGDFSEIYEKIGFSSFTNGRDDVFAYLKDYNFFDRVSQGDLLDSEKQEFIFYIKNCIENLKLKGTPMSIEKAIANFGLIAKIKELWVTTFKTEQYVPIKDEVFNDDIRTNTGLCYKTVSSPNCYNNESIIINNKLTPYIEINTATKIDSTFYLKDSEVTYINGKPYIAVEKT